MRHLGLPRYFQCLLALLSTLALTACGTESDGTADKQIATIETASSALHDPVAAALMLKGIEPGKHYDLINQPFATEGPEIEVTEFFWYGCGHCQQAEPMVKYWKENLPGNSRIRKLPAIWNKLMEMHGKLFFIVEMAADESAKQPLHEALFSKIIELRQNKATAGQQLDELKQLIVDYGVDAAKFDELYSSGNIQNRIEDAQKAQKLANIAATPSFIVDGKYYLRTDSLSKELTLIDIGNSIIEVLLTQK